jgi:hypothetical protein
MDDVAPLRFMRIGFAHHVHDDERIDAAPPRRSAWQTAGSRQVEAKVLRHVHSQFLEVKRGKTVTLSPHSNANQAMFTAKAWLEATGLLRRPTAGGRTSLLAQYRQDLTIKRDDACPPL